MDAEGRPTKAEARDEILIAALAAGQVYTAAATTARMSERTVRRRMADPTFAAEVARRRGLHVHNVTGMLLATAEDAVEVIVESMRAESDGVRLRAAELMLTLVRRFHSDSNIEARIAALESTAAAPAPSEEADDAH